MANARPVRVGSVRAARIPCEGPCGFPPPGLYSYGPPNPVGQPAVAPTRRSPLAAWIAGLARRPLAGAADADLLRRFAEARDEPAFAELVRRYGPLVWRVARTALGPGPAAEDVFQVTFLALARGAGAVRRPDALAGWLH